MNRRRVAIVGGGPGGLAAAMLLSHRGFDVEVFEQQPHLGGRSGALRLGPHVFDVGSTMVMMPFVFEELFELSGMRLSDHVKLVPVEPMYHLDFGDRALDMYADAKRMVSELERFAPGQGAGLDRFMSRERLRLTHLYPMLQRSWPGLRSMLSGSVLSALPHVGFVESLYDAASESFTDEALRLAFSFQAAYLGMSPWACPAGFGMVPYVEHAWGLYHVQGGVHQLNEAMAKAARRSGAAIHTGTTVRHLTTEADRAVALSLEDGTRIAADYVVINADATTALSKLLDDDVSLLFNRARLRHLHESCSTFMLYLGLDRELPLAHHTFFFAGDYRAEMRRVFEEGSLGRDISLYVCNPTASDPRMAPPGQSSVYLLCLVPNTKPGIDWSKQADGFRTLMLATLEQRLGTPVERHIKREARTTPADWCAQGISHGAVFGPAHSLDQLLALRLPNRLPRPNNVFLTGGGTSPGSGLPTILESARIATRMICEDSGVSFPHSRDLPAPLHVTNSQGALS